MPQIAFASQTTTPAALLGLPPAEDEQLQQFCRLNGLRPQQTLLPGQAYSLDSGNCAAILHQLNCPAPPDRLALRRASALMGEEVHTLAAFAGHHLTDDKLSYLNSLIGAATTAAVTRLDGFERALLDYQSALLQLRQSIRPDGGRPAHANTLSARREAALAYQ